MGEHQSGNNLDLRITAIVPPDATSGPITVVTPHGDVTSTATFHVLPPPLSIGLMTGGTVELRRPTTSDALALEWTDDPATGHRVPVDQAPLRFDDHSALTLVPAGTRFYRLVER